MPWESTVIREKWGERRDQNEILFKEEIYFLKSLITFIAKIDQKASKGPLQLTRQSALRGFGDYSSN